MLQAEEGGADSAGECVEEGRGSGRSVVGVLLCSKREPGYDAATPRAKILLPVVVGPQPVFVGGGDGYATRQTDHGSIAGNGL